MTIMVNGNNLGDTTLTKVFVGGLAWETPKEAMRDHFEKYGEILEAVIISDKATGRSKGYGFVTFKEPEAAKKACEDASPIINGRRANCNLASLGARRPRHSSNMPPPSPAPQGGGNSINVVVVGQRGPNGVAPAAPWYYQPGAAPSPVQAAAAAPPYVPQHHQHQHQHHQAVPYYGYSPAYIAPADHMNYNNASKVGYTGGSYVNGHYPQMYPGQPMMPVYSVYHFHHQPQTMGLPAQLYSPTTQGPLQPLMSKPASFAPPPNAVCLAVE